jgi:murein DD-endopeptidase MepM/ murein hydrolase activator NlpD
MRVFPVAGRSQYADTWGAARDAGRSHQGTDIFAALGTPVVAVDDGNARKADDPKGGQVIYLQAADGGHYYYAHLDGYEGDFPRKVRAGDVIGRVGKTGNAANTSPHLHFEIHPAGAGGAVNPYPELQAVPSSSSSPPSSSSSTNSRAILALLVLWALSANTSTRHRRAYG